MQEDNEGRDRNWQKMLCASVCKVIARGFDVFAG